MTTRARHGAIVAAIALSSACADLKSPSEITDPDLLAVRVVPAAVEPGGEARIEIFAADEDGPIADVPSSWEVGPGLGGAPPLGAVEEGSDGGPVYTAPQELGDDDGFPLAVLEGEIALPQRDVRAVKTVAIGEDAENPSIERVAMGGEAIGERGAVAAGDEVELTVEADIPLDDPGDVAWAVTVGELHQFLRTPSTWTLPEDAPEEEAWLYVVVRDGQDGDGGADWRAFPVDVE